MDTPLFHLPPVGVEIDYEKFVTEDDTPVDGIFADKQHRLLAQILEESWPGPNSGRPFVAMTNVGLFYSPREPAIVPDFMLSLDVT